jgi:hypothetical protein
MSMIVTEKSTKNYPLYKGENIPKNIVATCMLFENKEGLTIKEYKHIVSQFEKLLLTRVKDEEISKLIDSETKEDMEELQ